MKIFIPWCIANAKNRFGYHYCKKSNASYRITNNKKTKLIGLDCRILNALFKNIDLIFVTFDTSVLL